MLFEVIRNDIIKVKVAAIVNTANPRPVWGVGIDAAIYKVEEEKQPLPETIKFVFGYMLIVVPGNK